jgi:hypothetical protein
MHSLRSLRTLFEELVGEDENYGQNLQTVYANYCALICCIKTKKMSKKFFSRVLKKVVKMGTVRYA